jgi:c-di-GMP-binding flagellar brake protein YcgR
LDSEVSEDGRPLAGQAVQVLAPRADAMRLIPGQLLEESRGRSLQVAVSGRVSRVQRREDVRARVKLPPVSAVRLSRDGRPVGLLGLNAVDLSAGGIRVTSEEPLRGGDQLRLALRLGQGDPLTINTEILVGGLAAQGRFGPMAERDRQRIVRYVYQQELSQRREQAAQTAD